MSYRARREKKTPTKTIQSVATARTVTSSKKNARTVNKQDSKAQVSLRGFTCTEYVLQYKKITCSVVFFSFFTLFSCTCANALRLLCRESKEHDTKRLFIS